jgi:hypothetical protein
MLNTFGSKLPTISRLLIEACPVPRERFHMTANFEGRCQTHGTNNDCFTILIESMLLHLFIYINVYYPFIHTVWSVSPYSSIVVTFQRVVYGTIFHEKICGKCKENSDKNFIPMQPQNKIYY